MGEGSGMLNETVKLLAVQGCVGIALLLLTFLNEYVVSFMITPDQYWSNIFMKDQLPAP